MQPSSMKEGKEHTQNLPELAMTRVFSEEVHHPDHCQDAEGEGVVVSPVVHRIVGACVRKGFDSITPIDVIQRQVSRSVAVITDPVLACVNAQPISQNL